MTQASPDSRVNGVCSGSILVEDLLTNRLHLLAGSRAAEELVEGSSFPAGPSRLDGRGGTVYSGTEAERDSAIVAEIWFLGFRG